jgi:hypothetical protein
MILSSIQYIEGNLCRLMTMLLNPFTELPFASTKKINIPHMDIQKKLTFSIAGLQDDATRIRQYFSPLQQTKCRLHDDAF